MGFYSPTEAAALNLQRKSGQGQAFLNDIMKGENVRPDEINAMGLDTLLKGKTNVTADEVRDYIAKNKIQLGESRYGDQIKEDPIKLEKRNEILEEYQPKIAQLRKELNFTPMYVKEGDRTLNNPQYEEIKNRLTNLVNEREIKADAIYVVPERKPTKFQGYQLPGGENYREVVLTLPTEGRGLSEIELDKINRRLVDQGYDGLGEDQRAVAMRGGNEAMDMLQDLEDRVGIRTDDLMKAMAGGDPRTQYRSSHWDEPNVLAHLRMSDRVTDGKKTLLVDEVQSDWHQAGRDQGYKLPPEATAPMDSEYRSLVHKNADAVAQGLTPDPKDVARAKMLEEQLMQSDSSKVPNAPYKEDWYQLALRRAVKEAIDGGYDRVALPTGARVNERFDLSKQIDRIDYNKNPDGTYNMSAIKNGSEVFAKEDLDEKELSGIIGKDVAKKIVGDEGSSAPKADRWEAEDGDVPEFKSLSGLDLQVGGEGNRKYYDEIYPGYLKKFGKKYGASVGKTTVDADGVAEPLHYMDITPAMRESFKTGIHMKKGGKVQFANDLNAMKYELAKAK
jgi:hypothetical protein